MKRSRLPISILCGLVVCMVVVHTTAAFSHPAADPQDTKSEQRQAKTEPTTEKEAAAKKAAADAALDAKYQAWVVT